MRASSVFLAGLLAGASAFLSPSTTPSTVAMASVPRASVFYDTFIADLPSMAGKTVAVTGASRGLGFVTAVALARLGARVCVLNRPSARGAAALAAIAAAATGEAPFAIDCDLLDFASVRNAAAQLLERTDGLDALCLNAGIMMAPAAASADGYDVTASSNVLSHVLLTRELLPALLKAAKRGEARIVSMSSGSGFGGPEFDAAFFARRGSDVGGGYPAYHQSKLANLIFTAALHDRLRGTGVKALACTPGVCGTDMFLGVAGPGADLARVQSPEDGALAQMLCLCGTVESGQLFGPIGGGGLPIELPLQRPNVLVDEDAKARLWQACEAAIGPFDI
ncbi:hypothetical protein M885DRAFT_504719 [Pelagophyceae sp. CCMP2097]|nr:hypothetical protein M885DRAFT_504719 [Pelagophyceae sp. CCMP2097]